MNYPKQDINRITDDFNKEYTVMRNLNRMASVANLKAKFKLSNNDEEFSISESKRKKRKMSIQHLSAIQVVKEPAINCKSVPLFFSQE